MAKKWQKKFTLRAGVISQIRPTSIGNPSSFFFQLEELGRSARPQAVVCTTPPDLYCRFRGNYEPVSRTISPSPLPPRETPYNLALRASLQNQRVSICWGLLRKVCQENISQF